MSSRAIAAGRLPDTSGSGSGLRRAVYLYGGLGIRILCTLALIPLLGRTLGPAAYGVFAVANSLTLVVWQIVEFGVPLIASRRFVQAKSQPERDAALTMATFARLALVPLALAAGAAIVFVSPVLDGQLGIALLAGLLGVQSGMNFGWMLTALGASKLQSVLETAPAVATLLLCLLLVRGPQDVAIVFGAMNLAACVANGCAWYHARRHARHRRPGVAEVAAALRSGRSVFAYRVALVGIGSGSAYILGYFASANELGNYALADRLLSAAAGLLQPLAVVAFPQSIRLFASAPGQAARTYAVFTAKVVAVTLAVAAAVLIAGPRLIPLAMGAEYAPSIPYITLLIWTLPLMALSQMVVSCILYPLHRDLEIGLVYVAGAVLLGAAAAWLLPLYGARAMLAVRIGVEAVIAVLLCAVAVRAVRSSGAGR